MLPTRFYYNSVDVKGTNDDWVMLKNWAIEHPTDILAYMDIETSGHKWSLEFDLYFKEVPWTASNFAWLCINEYTHDNSNTAHRNDKIFHRFIRDFMIQGGDFTLSKGAGGESAFAKDSGARLLKFDDENFTHRHTGPGDLSMANAGPNTNGSQFFITAKQTSWLDGRHVVFGKARQTESVEAINAILPPEGSKQPFKLEMTASGLKYQNTRYNRDNIEELFALIKNEIERENPV